MDIFSRLLFRMQLELMDHITLENIFDFINLISYAALTLHVNLRIKEYSRNEVGRGYLVAVTGSTWQLRGVFGKILKTF